MQGKTNTRQDLLKSDRWQETEPQTRRQYNYLSYADKNESSTVSPYRKLMTPPKNSSRRSKEKQVPQKVIPFVVPETIAFENKPFERNFSIENNIKEQNISCSDKSMIQQMQRLKMMVGYLQNKVKELRVENEQVMRQKRKINENYISLLNKNMVESDAHMKEVSQMKLKHSQQLSNSVQELKRISQQQKLRYEGEVTHVKGVNKAMLEQIAQLRSLQEISDHQYKQSMQKLAEQQRTANKHSIYLQEKLKSYQDLLYKKEFHLQQIQTKYNLLQKQMYLQSLECDNNKAQLDTRLKQNQILKEENVNIHCKLKQLQSNIKFLQTNIKLLQQNKKQMTQQISTLLQIDQHKESSLSQQQHTLQTLTKQMHSLKTINDQLLEKLQSNEIKNQQQHYLLVRQVQSLKQRQKTLLQNERSLKDIYTLSLEKKTQQVEELLRENQRLYKEMNKLKFNSK